MATSPGPRAGVRVLPASRASKASRPPTSSRCVVPRVHSPARPAASSTSQRPSAGRTVTARTRTRMSTRPACRNRKKAGALPSTSRRGWATTNPTSANSWKKAHSRGRRAVMALVLLAGGRIRRGRGTVGGSVARGRDVTSSRGRYHAPWPNVRGQCRHAPGRRGKPDVRPRRFQYNEAMDIDIRAITPEQGDQFSDVLATAFGETLGEEERADHERWFEYDRSIVAFDGDRMVGTGGAYSMDLTLPGLTTIPIGGLTAISVLPTHRRRGILRSMIAYHFEEVERRGELVSALGASESVIYGRFGYGLATTFADYEI